MSDQRKREAAVAAARTIGLLLGGCVGVLFTMFGLFVLWTALLVQYPAPTCLGSIAAIFAGLLAQVWWDQYREELRLRSSDAHDRS